MTKKYCQYSFRCEKHVRHEELINPIQSILLSVQILHGDYPIFTVCPRSSDPLEKIFNILFNNSTIILGSMNSIG